MPTAPHRSSIRLAALLLAVVSAGTFAQDAPRARARDLGVAPGIFAPGTHNATPRLMVPLAVMRSQGIVVPSRGRRASPVTMPGGTTSPAFGGKL